MALNLTQKKSIVAGVSIKAGASVSLAIADYRGLTTNQMTELRAQARRAGVSLQVVRNTLAKKAFSGTSFECVSEKLVGPMILAFSLEAPGAAARLIKDFSKGNERLKIIALSVGGKLYGPEHLDAVASLPTRDEALALLLSVMKAPITKFVRTLAAPHEKVVRTLAAVADQKKSEQA